jgi:asparagine N-glycosylation enzyme membrane subunit Stt3
VECIIWIGLEILFGLRNMASLKKIDGALVIFTISSVLTSLFIDRPLMPLIRSYPTQKNGVHLMLFSTVGGAFGWSTNHT